MTTMQLVRRRSHRGVVEAGVVASPPNADPFSFRAEGQGPWLLGSEQLLHLAAALARAGYRAIRVTLEDALGGFISDEENEEYSDELCNLINGGKEPELDNYMNVDLSRLRAVIIDLRGREVTQGQISLRAHGVVITNSPWQAEHFGEVIRTAMTLMR